MSHEATTFILRATTEEQAEYAAAAHKNSPAADVEGASASGVQTGRGAESARALGHEAGNETSGQPSAMRADTSPRWASVDDTTSDLLTLVAERHPATPSEVEEWEHFRKVLAKVAAENDGLIDQNRTRPLLRGEIAPRRVGAFFHRATKAGLIRAEGWTTSDDREGKNSGRPCRSYVWIEATS